MTGCTNQNSQTSSDVPLNKPIEVKSDERDKKIVELQKLVSSQENTIKELQDKLQANEAGMNFSKEEKDNYKRFVDSVLKYLNKSQLPGLAEGEWGYTIKVDEKPVSADGVVNLDKSSFNVSFSERQISYPPILPVEIHNSGMISGSRFTDHLKVLDYKPSNISEPAGTSVEAIVYEFKNVPSATTIKLQVSKELQDRIGLKTDVISISVR
jgi:uncharacterized coiled-coil protein SlyX